MKLPFEFGIPFFFRILIPGLIWSVISYPFFRPLFKYILSPVDLQNILKPESLIIIPESIIVGIIIFLMDSQIYKFYEGLRFWPESIHNGLTKRFNERIKEKYRQALEGSSKGRRLWMEVGMYPQDDKGFPTAVSPTMLGNVILGYERYSSSRYGMDATFYWPRIMLQIDKDTRNELDNRGAYADLAVYSTFVLSVLSLIFFVMLTFPFFQPIVPLSLSEPVSIFVSNLFLLIEEPEWYFSLSALIFTLFSSYFFYRLAVSQHFQYGEFFKAVFDLYKDKVPLAEYGQAWLDQKEKYKKHCRLLRYNLIRCSSCKKLYPATQLNCPHCSNQESDDIN